MNIFEIENLDALQLVLSLHLRTILHGEIMYKYGIVN